MEHVHCGQDLFYCTADWLTDCEMQSSESITGKEWALDNNIVLFNDKPVPSDLYYSNLFAPQFIHSSPPFQVIKFVATTKKPSAIEETKRVAGLKFSDFSAAEGRVDFWWVASSMEVIELWRGWWWGWSEWLRRGARWSSTTTDVWRMKWTAKNYCVQMADNARATTASA